MQHTEFEIASGSVVGRDHRLAHRNCQDGLSVVSDNLCTIGIVTDGCGSGAHSETGAQLGAQLLSKSLWDEVHYRGWASINWSRVRQDVLANLQVLARGMGGNFREVVQEYFLFTVVGFLLASETITFFAIGDGVAVINGQLFDLRKEFDKQDEDLPPGNAPPYLGYGLLQGSVAMDASELDFRKFGPFSLDGVEHFLVGTDGVLDLVDAEERLLPGLKKPVGNLSQFWTEDRFFANPDIVSRQLRLAARDWPKRDPSPGLLPDDTTLIAGRLTPNPA